MSTATMNLSFCQILRRLPKYHHHKLLSSVFYSSNYGKFSVGDYAKETKQFTEDDVHTFARISGDTNPVHVDKEFAKTTRYGKPIVHGILTCGMISGLLGAKMPGTGAILLSLNTTYHSPVFIGEEVLAEVRISEIKGRQAVLNVDCSVPQQNKVVIKGCATVLLPKQGR